MTKKKTKPTPLSKATKPTAPTWRGALYKSGDGDHTVYIPRPGSDHSHLKSFGNLT